jgi:hypothetical protein
MSVGFIDIDIVGGRRSVEAMLDHLDSALSEIGMQIFMNGRVAPALRERAAARFRNEGDDAVGRWQALSEPTQEWRAGYGFPPSHPINRRTGELEDYVTSAPSRVVATRGFALLTWPASPPSNPYTAKKLRTAQTGADHPSTPKRPVLGLGETDLLHVLSQLAFHIQGWDRSIR